MEDNKHCGVGEGRKEEIYNTAWRS